MRLCRLWGYGNFAANSKPQNNANVKTLISLFLYCIILIISFPAQGQHHHHRRGGGGEISGQIVSTEKGEKAVDFATVYLKGTTFGGTTNNEGYYRIKAPCGNYTLVVSALGYKTVEKPVSLKKREPVTINITLTPEEQILNEVTVFSTGVNRVQRSAYNAVAVDTKELANTTKNLSDALAKAPGMKLRESGGVGSDMQVMLDGFSGKHVKIFIDGVPQEGVGSSFGLNNIPVNFADRIEIYKGVVPVGFGTDAIGGVINIVTNQKRRRWFLDAAYSYGSFNTHKSHVNFGQTFKNGFTYEINAFQNYSDNTYHIDADHVEQWKEDGSSVITDEVFRVKRFNDTFHNEALVVKAGFVDKPWADRLMIGVTGSNMYKEIQTGVRQHTVFGEKHRRGQSLMPSIEYSKRDLFVKGLKVSLTANYNRNVTTNIDTADYRYNWFGERKLQTNGRGEQSEQYARSYNNNWNATATVVYRLSQAHTFTLNNVWNAFHRTNSSLLTGTEIENEFAKDTRKNIAGLSYRLMPSERWNLSLFGKYYHQYVSGPMATDDKGTEFVMVNRTVNSAGYGAAGTCFLLPELQAKLSYEKAYRLPSIEEMFGDEDLESGEVNIRPEKSDNYNLNLSYSKTAGKHSIYAEGGLLYRHTKDYIQRNIQDLSGGKENATYTNYGKVVTKGYNLSLRYRFGRWFDIGGNFTQMDVRDMEKYQIGSTGNSTPNLTYKARMANIPYMFADSDINFYWHDFGRKGNLLTLTYDNRYLHSFCYNSEVIGTNSNAYMIPDQFSHNLAIGLSLKNGRYNLSFECQNLTDEKLYDNFSLQKAGRAFYGKIRVHFGD